MDEFGSRGIYQLSAMHNETPSLCVARRWCLAQTAVARTFTYSALLGSIGDVLNKTAGALRTLVRKRLRHGLFSASAREPGEVSPLGSGKAKTYFNTGSQVQCSGFASGGGVDVCLVCPLW